MENLVNKRKISIDFNQFVNYQKKINQFHFSISSEISKLDIKLVINLHVEITHCNKSIFYAIATHQLVVKTVTICHTFQPEAKTKKTKQNSNNNNN